MEKQATYATTYPSDDSLPKAFAAALGEDEGHLISVFARSKDMSAGEYNALMHVEIGDLERIRPILVSAGILRPIWRCVTKRFGPLSVVDMVPRL